MLHHEMPKKKYLKALTILESLVVTLISIILMQCVCASLFLISKFNLQAQNNLKHLNASQYIYWLFHQQISENIGVLNITQEQIKHLTREDINKILYFNYSEDQKNQKVVLLSAEDFIRDYKLSKFIAKKVKSDSTVIKIKQLAVKKNIQNAKQTKFDISIIEKIYYIGQKYANKKFHYGLFQYSNNYSDELVADVTDMQIKKVVHWNQVYYYFQISFVNFHSNTMKNNLNKITFMICNC